MREFLNENTLFTSIVMATQDDRSLLLVVEGDDDWLALKEHCSEGLRLMAGVGGRENVLRAAELAAQQKIPRVRFLVDRDYDFLLTPEKSFPELVLTSDRHDVFVDLIANQVTHLCRVIEIHATVGHRQPWSTLHLQLSAETVLKNAVGVAGVMGVLRAACKKCGFGVDFSRLSVGSLKLKMIDIDSLVHEAQRRSLLDEDQVDSIISAVREFRLEAADPLDTLVGDHDLFSSLALVMRGLGVRDASSKNLHKAFLSAASCEGLITTSWFEEIQEWCAANESGGFKCESRSKIAA